MTNLVSRSLTGAITAIALTATIVASATPAAAQWRGHRGHGGWGWGPGIAAGVIGGLALGALATRSNRYSYAEPIYDEPIPVYAEPNCYKEWRPVYRADGAYLRDRLVRVCR